MTLQPTPVARFIEPLPNFSKKVDKILALMGGTTEMRKRGVTYLPQFEGETDKTYELRRELSVLFNGFRKTVNDVTGRIFEKPVMLSEDSPTRFLDWAKDIDLEGRSLSVFSHDVLRKGIQFGVQYLMVDAPIKMEGQTVADDIRQNNRPYILSIDPLNVLGFKLARVNNQQVLSQIRIREWIAEPDGEFGEKSVEQIRVLDRTETNVQVRLFRKAYGKNQAATHSWAQHGETIYTGLSEITITAFYTNRVAFMKGEPFLDDLADLNIAHWQSQSDQRNILHFCRVPILFASGLDPKQELKISASSLTRAEDPAARMSFVEHSGAAISAGKDDLKHLEFLMEVQGLQVVVEQIGLQTATGEMRNDKKENTRLALIAANLQSALEICMGWMGDYGGEEFTGSVQVHKEFAPTDISPQILQTLLTMVQTGKLSRASFWREMVRRGVLDDDFTIEDEQDRIDDEGGDLVFGADDG